MKIESTNVTVIANNDMQFAKIKLKGQEFTFPHEVLEELRDVLNDYFEMLYGSQRKD